jgi:hypothetical protein
LKYALKIAPVHVSPAIQVNATKSILAHGFARARCPDCTAEFLVAFSLVMANGKKINLGGVP